MSKVLEDLLEYLMLFGIMGVGSILIYNMGNISDYISRGFSRKSKLESVNPLCKKVSGRTFRESYFRYEE
jgi:hypothetical protein